MVEKHLYQRATHREREVLQLMVEGRSRRDIADVVHIGVKRVEAPRAHVTDKLDMHGTAGLTRCAIRKAVTSLKQ